MVGRKIILGVCGSIAAYKSALITRLLVKAGAEVRVIMTPAASEFITPLTLATLSKNPVLIDFSKDKTGEWNNHVELGLWADALVIAPATAHTLAKMASGLCDDLLTAVYLSARCPVYFAPAMDLDMMQHPTTLRNIKGLESFGNQLIAPDHGELASGLIGLGRMAEPETIVEYLTTALSQRNRLKGKKALVTAGPTYEAIDPVRFIGNHSSGKMGFALAEALAQEGAEVNLVTGPTQEHTQHPLINVHHVTSAAEMLEASQSIFEDSDIAVFSAAVADYRPAEQAAQKIKKSADNLVVNLVPTADIAKTLGERKRPGQITVGFALETENEEQNALKKLKTKNFDFIVLNSLNEPGAGFRHDTNKVTILDRNQSKTSELKTKQEVAADIVEAIIKKQNA